MRDETIEGSLGGMLERRRRSSFVGREAELELVQSVLDDEGPRLGLLFVHGPAGIGKSSLLVRIADLAIDNGAHVVHLDGHDLAPRADEFLDALHRQIDHADEGAIGGSGGRRLLLLVDGYERLAPLDGWLRDEFLPRLTASSLVVLASREPLNPGWRADPGWRDLLRVVTLRNLEPSEGLDFLERCGVAEHDRERLVEVSHGHPLALGLMADVAMRGGMLDADPLGPDLVRVLVARLLDSVPDDSRKRVLGAAALARVTTESLLRDVVGDDAHDGFRWLSELSFVEAAADGLALHQLARDVLEADLRWRDPAAYRDVFRGVRDHICRGVTSRRGVEQRRAIHDLKYLFRVIPGVLSPVDWSTWGSHQPEPAESADRDAILELVALHEGDDAAHIAAGWWDAQPDAFTVVRDGSTIDGVIALIDLTEAPPAVRDADPGARAAWEHAHGVGPPRPGERVTQTRIIVDRAEYQQPSPTLNLVPVLTLQRYLEMPELAWDFLTLAEPDQWDEYFAIADLPRVAGGDFRVGGSRFGLFAHDFRAVPVDALITLWTERALAQGDLVEPPATASADVLVLSHTEFKDAVRQALQDLRRPELLERNVLCRTRLARDAAPEGAEPGASTVESLVVDGVDSLRRDPRDAKRLRVIEQTYLAGAPSQEAAAEVLGLPSSTYRRQLSQGVDRIVAWLWDQEIYGPGK
jgi:hypothetical protein